MKYDIDALYELHKDEIRELKELEDELIDEPLDPFWEAFFDEARIISVVGQPDFKNLPL